MTALSLANLCFLSAWLVLLNPAHYSSYNWGSNTGFAKFIGLGVDILLLAFLFWLFAALARRSSKPAVMRFARWALLLTLVMPFSTLLHNYPEGDTVSTLNQHKLLAAASLTVALLLLWTLIRYQRLATRTVVGILLILSPLPLVNFSYTLWLRHKYGLKPEFFATKSAPPLVQTKSGPHVLWIVFDEMDQRTAFDARPSTLELPELDRLRNEAIFAERAYPPAGFTNLSMPALISGRFVAGVTPISPDKLEIQFVDEEVSEWSAQPNVFSRAREMGFKTAVVGWSQPYCPVLGGSLDVCRWEPIVARNRVSGQLTVTSSMRLWGQGVLYAMPFMFRILREEYEAGRRDDHIAEFTTLIQYARELWARPDLNLTLLHFPVPHPPWIYNRKKRALSNDAGSTYIDNLALADHTFGELRQSLEAAGIWEQSAILVTSDHWWRAAPTLNGRRDHRVPFILKLPGQKQRRAFSEDFNTIVTRELLLSILQGKLSGADSALRWLDEHHSIGEGEFTKDLP